MIPKRNVASFVAPPKMILRRYDAWRAIATSCGPPGLRLSAGLHDDTLLGEWQGYRSASLGQLSRIIYRVSEIVYDRPVEQDQAIVVAEGVPQASPDAPAAPGEKDRLHRRSHPCS